MATIQSSIELYNHMTPTLQSISNALNVTISHFEQMQRLSGNSFDTASLQEARQELRNAEADIIEIQEALTGVSRTGQNVTRSFENVGRTANNMTQSIGFSRQMMQQLADIAGNSAAMSEQSIGQITQMIEQQTNAILNMSDTINQAFDRTSNNIRRQSRQTNEQVGFLQRGFQRVANTVRNTVQQNARLNNIVQRTVGENTRLGRSIRTAWNFQRNLTNSVRGMFSNIRSATGAQNIFNRALANGGTSANGLLGTIKGIAGAYLSLKGFDFLGSMSDKVTSVLSRLDLMNDGLQTTKELSDKILRSSFDAGSSYITTAESIAKMGLNAGSAFQSNDELIAFMDQINKTFAIGGATAEEQNNAMIQLTQAMAAGALRGEELNSILDSGPGIARNIEKYMGWAEGSIKNYAEDGKVTAQVVKNAMLSMAEETNEKFNSMPATISQTFTRIKTLAVKSFTPILQGINGLFNNQNANTILYRWGAMFQYIADRATATIEKIKSIVNSEKFVSFSNDIITAFSAAGAVITWIFDTIVGAFNYVVENWDSVRPVLLGIATALGVVTAAQWALNIAMSLNPVTIIIGLITALIVLFYKVVDRINEVKNTSISATAVIAGVFAGLYAIARNIFTTIWNVVATVVNFTVNFFQDGISAIQVLFLELGETATSVLEGIVGAMASMAEKIHMPDKITNGLKKVENTLEGYKNNFSNKAQEIKDKAGFKDVMKKIKYTNVQETIENVVLKVTGFENGIKGFMENFDPFSGIKTTNDLLADVLKNIAKDTDKIAGSLERDKEDLAFLRTVANIKYGDKYVMPQVKVEMTNNNTIQSEMDLDGFFDKKVEEIGNLINMSAEGVHI